ncbi:MAG: 4-(cytidine 5'-diphospho)-2-C-methyl-D-erythritol kinase [Deltaproteobacteria bacterium]|nr:4-(cytidine 5'-diphospho)-2-C-methyl-D-erythritol kinase [Deltaproteobacteria bacterium]MBW2419105.1 4-(cytidine 5'-diphospho)-2-C-methyl-D-erythritol kinase [Deltaproteobacteria bacterium]
MAQTRRADAGSAAGVLSLPAPAKVNLGLRVLGCRADGYHLLESLFVPLDLADHLRVEIEPERGSGPPEERLSFRLAGSGGAEPAADVPRGPENLAVRAALRFLEAAGNPPVRVALELRKEIPSAAGLGGGSSDAAAVLRALDSLLPGSLPEGRLASLALELGADVPFFLAPSPALVTGIGERIEPLPGLPELWLLLANPGVSLSTAEVFRHYDVLAATLTPVEAGSTMRALSGFRSGPAGLGKALGKTVEETVEEAVGEALESALHAGLLVNDLEPAARRLCPPIARLCEGLRGLGALDVGMSGSGATVFGVFGSEEEARAGLSAAEFEAPVWLRVARTIAGTNSGTKKSRDVE